MPQGAVVTMAGFTGVSGAVALLTGLAGLRRIRRLRRAGLDVWALVKRTGAVGGEDNPRPVLQYTTEDGRVMEVGSPVPASKRQPFAEGSHVLVRYDPEDPRELVLYGHERAAWEYAMAGVGAVFVLLGAGLLLGQSAHHRDVALTDTGAVFVPPGAGPLFEEPRPRLSRPARPLSPASRSR